MSFKIYLLILTSIVCFNAFEGNCQTNEPTAICISHESDYEYHYKQRSRNEVLINYEMGSIYYRKKSSKKFKRTKIPMDFYFKDSIDYDRLNNSIVNSHGSEATCSFRNKGSIKITLIYGNSHQIVSRTFEFGTAIECKDEKDMDLFKQISFAYATLYKQIF